MKLLKYSENVSVIVGGSTYEERSIKGVRVSFSKENEKKAVFLEGGIHACEWYLNVLFSLI